VTMRSFFLALPQRFLIALVRGYRIALSPWLGSSCRFEPTCSAYALEAFESHGAAAGTYLTLMRIARCHPGCAGGFDPVPTRRMQLLARSPGHADQGRAAFPSDGPNTP
jgi:putative membrane protein insertion efficiency factor